MLPKQKTPDTLKKAMSGFSIFKIKIVMLIDAKFNDAKIAF